MSTVVIDVGCATHGGDASIPHLLVDYAPDMLIGFDPSAEDALWTEGDAVIATYASAAWIFSGEIGWQGAGIGGQVDEGGRTQVRCVDLAEVILAVAEGDVILKLDCEGAEYTLLPHLVATGAAARLRELCVEWHCETCGYGIWDDSYHPSGCTADWAEWRARKERMIALLPPTVKVTGWSR